MHIPGSELSKLKWPADMTYDWNSSTGMLQMCLPASSGGSGPTYTAGNGISLIDNIITNTKTAYDVKVGTDTWQRSSVDTLEFMHSTAALSGSTLQVMRTHTYYYAGSGISVGSDNTISNTAQGSPPWIVTVFNENTEYPTLAVPGYVILGNIL